MHRWEFTCPLCHLTFAHIEPDSSLLHYAHSKLPLNPDAPKGGIHLQCPHCGITSLYQRSQLTLAE